MSDNESTQSLEEQSPQVDFPQLLEKLEQCILDSREKDERIKNAEFVIAKSNNQLSESLNELKLKDKTISKQREEIKHLEKQLRKRVSQQAEINRLQEKQNRLAKTAEKSIRKLNEESDLKNEQISKLSSFNNTLTSDKIKIEQTKKETYKSDLIQLERDLNKSRAAVKKSNQERDYFEKENLKNKESLGLLKEKYTELHREFQTRKIEELLSVDKEFDFKEDLETSGKIRDFRKLRKIQNSFKFVYFRTKIKNKMTEWVIFEKRKYQRFFPIFSAFHVVKLSGSFLEREKLRLVVRFAIGKLGDLETDFNLKIERIEKFMKNGLMLKLRKNHFLVLQKLKNELGCFSELISRNVERDYRELVHVTKNLKFNN